jgi:hypothetical protein
MPKRKPFRLQRYDLTKRFSTVSGSTYYDTSDPSEHLILWARAANKDPVPLVAEDASTQDHDVTFIATSRLQESRTSPFDEDSFSNITSPVRFQKDSGGPYVSVEDADDLSFGDGSTDSSFTLASWFLITSASATTSLFHKGTETMFGDAREYAFVYHDGGLTGSLIDASAEAALLYSASIVSEATEGTWHHFAFTYNSAASELARGQIYFDGLSISTNPEVSGSYTAMEPSIGTLDILDNRDNQPVEFFDAAIWSGKVLSAEEVNALYNAKDGLVDVVKDRVYIKTSGITSLPPRPYLRNTDNATGSYPTTYRLGDSRTGHYSASFDETKVMRFHGFGGTDGLTGNVILGQQLPTYSQYTGSLVTNTNLVPDLSVTSSQTSVVPGISDARVQFTPGDDYTPFVEDNLFAAEKVSSGEAFWSTGTLPSIVGAGFTNPLWSKTKIEIDLEPDTMSEIYWSTGSSISSIGSGFSYYNFDLKQWEMLGTSVTGSAVDYVHAIRQIATGSLLAYTPGRNSTWSGLGDDSLAQRVQLNAGYPTTYAGFPSAEQFNATSSQLFDVGSVIRHPFLVEKIVYEFSGSLPLGAHNTLEKTYYNFGIINHHLNSKPENSLAVTFINSGTNQTGTPSTDPNNYSMDQMKCPAYRKVTVPKDLVSCGVVSVCDDFDSKPFQLRDLNIEPTTTSPSTVGVTGSYIISMSANTPVFTETLQYHDAIAGSGKRAGFSSTTDLYRFLSWRGGGRSGLADATIGGFLSSGRSFSRSNAGANLSGSLGIIRFDVATSGLGVQLYDEVRQDTPYLLLPEDKLSFYWANQKWPTYTGATEKKVSEFKLKISPGAGKLVIYGSMIREGKEFHQGLNQHLTSDAVHEDVQSSATDSTPYCLDQFDVDYETKFSGSYIDLAFEQVEGREFGNPSSRIGFRPNSVLGGKAGTTGSILRGLALIDTNERYQDSFFPDPREIARVNQVSFVADATAQFGSSFYVMYPLGPEVDAVLDAPADLRWPRAFPFESDYGALEFENRVSRASRVLNATNFSGVAVDANSIFGDPVSTITGRNTSAQAANEIFAIMNISGAGTGTPPVDARKLFLKSFFGIGDAVNGNPRIVKNVSDAATSNFNGGNDVELRGFKYGLYNVVPAFTRAVYRRDRYGQFRDMLEQRVLTAFEPYRFEIPNTRDLQGGEPQTVNTLEQPVTILFKKTNATGVGDELRIELLDSEDYTKIATNNGTSGDRRAVWNEGCNVDRFARVTKPFFDSNPIFQLFDATQQNDDEEDSALILTLAE